MGSFVPILNRYGQSSFIKGWYSTMTVFVKTLLLHCTERHLRDLSYKPQLRGWLGRNPIVHKGVQVELGYSLRDRSLISRLR
jgi:MarR-like DNA-binding transcriptional regulator SgrR of sgrS sRNA